MTTPMKEPIDFEQTLEAAKRHAVSRFHENHDDGDSAIYEFAAAILQAHNQVVGQTKQQAELEKMQFMVVLLTDNDGTLTISNRAFVVAPSDNFTIESYEEPVTNNRVYHLRLYTEAIHDNN
jgi:mannose-6-phosphate isomerase class I